jgi:hypothetical protein
MQLYRRETQSKSGRRAPSRPECSYIAYALALITGSASVMFGVVLAYQVGIVDGLFWAATPD